jgi:putative ATPase
LPPQFKNEVFLKKHGDLTDKLWDEDALEEWEREENGGKRWEGRDPDG